MDYVIIGNSAAAVGAIEGIRKSDNEGRITVISSEQHHCYSRPLISYLLQGKTDQQKMKYRPDSFYEEHNCKTLFGKTVQKLDPNKKTISVQDGSEVSYDRLLVATGSSPFIPPMKGEDSVKNRHCFMSLNDALALEGSLFPDARVLIIGAGLIGLKCAEGIADRVSKIMVVDMANRILSSILDDSGAAIVCEHLEAQGMEFYLGNSVSEFNENQAILTDGTKLCFDILVTAVGVIPNTGLIKDSGGEVQRGIVVDENMQTSLDDVFAAGDCVESYDISLGSNRILAIMPNAYTGGYAAGCAMAGKKAPIQKAIPMNAIGFFGLHVLTAGTYSGEVYSSNEDGCYKRLFYENDRLNGYILIGNVDKAGIYTSLIREQTPLSSLDFDLVCEKPSLLAFSRNFRDEKLGGKSHEN